MFDWLRKLNKNENMSCPVKSTTFNGYGKKAIFSEVLKTTNFCHKSTQQHFLRCRNSTICREAILFFLFPVSLHRSQLWLKAHDRLRTFGNLGVAPTKLIDIHDKWKASFKVPILRWCKVQLYHSWAKVFFSWCALTSFREYVACRKF